MGKLFGTDGIRGVANEYPMTPEMALKVGQAVGLQFGGTKGSAVLIGRDTRISGQMIESALVAGFCSVGVDVMRAGIVPTPGVAYLTSATGVSAGIVVSASHNPYYDNGIKLFDSNGFKLSEKIEETLEKHILDNGALSPSKTNSKIGKVTNLTDHEERYKDHLKHSLPKECRISDFKVVLDCANGATHRIAPILFTDLGSSVEAFFNNPDGQNINDGCGSQHPHILAEKVKETDADIGFAFDGDGDRLIAVDEIGQILTGDQILAISARHLKNTGRLKNNIVVSTVMSNMGLGEALKEMGIENVITGVGDRYVMEEMRKQGAVLGGEESGHTVFLDHQTTGDGMLTALKLLEVM